MDEERCRSPSEINSFNLNGSIYDLNKKRKLKADQFGLPASKHKCSDHRLSPKPLATVEKNQQSEVLITSIEYGSEPESAKDSNSFVGDYESAMSVHRDAKFETEISKLWPSNAPSTSAEWSSNNVQDNQCLLDDATATGVTSACGPVYEGEEDDPHHFYKEIQAHQNLDVAIVDEVEYMCYGHGIGGLEPFIDRDFEKALCSKKVKPNLPVLSSDSWSVDQGPEPGRKPTIDQEFEQFFSTLML